MSDSSLPCSQVDRAYFVVLYEPLCEDGVVLFENALIFIALKLEQWEEDEGLYCVAPCQRNLFALSYSTSTVLLFFYGLLTYVKSLFLSIDALVVLY